MAKNSGKKPKKGKKDRLKAVRPWRNDAAALVVLSPAPAEPAQAEYAPRAEMVPYDENLLERARTQWQFGDWDSLSQLPRTTLQHHPDRAKLAMLAAAGHLQTGNNSEARQFVRLAQDWGCGKQLISRILIAGVHNSLGRASAVTGRREQALNHFHKSVAIGTPGGEARLLASARITQQLIQLGHPDAAQLQHALGAFGTASHDISPERPRRHLLQRAKFHVEQLARLDLGQAWAGNTINTVIFRHHAILTHGDFQYTAFYVDEHTLRLVQRKLAPAAASKTEPPPHTYDLTGDYNLRDAHNSISLGMDRQGHLHISYDHHATQLRYRRSLKPGDITAWSDELPMTGKTEDKVTYPAFILPHDGFPLALLYRDGVHNKGTARLKAYDEESQIWVDHPQAILSGSESKPWTSNAYWNHPAIGSDGSLHLSFVWRTHTLGKEDRINNINIGYACSPDNGLNWLTSKGRGYQLPITQVNAETVHPVSPGSNLINQCSMALDSRNRPHIVFYADDPNGIPQYQHLRYDGKKWLHQIISQRTQPFALKGHGTLQIPISRPEIVLDRQDNAYIITRGDHSQDRMVATLLAAPDYAWSPEDTQTVWDEDLGFAEPIIDRERWLQDNVLSMLLQHNEQPNHDIGHRSIDRSVTLLDIQFRIVRP